FSINFAFQDKGAIITAIKKLFEENPNFQPTVLLRKALKKQGIDIEGFRPGRILAGYPATENKKVERELPKRYISKRSMNTPQSQQMDDDDWIEWTTGKELPKFRRLPAYPGYSCSPADLIVPTPRRDVGITRKVLDTSTPGSSGAHDGKSRLSLTKEVRRVRLSDVIKDLEEI
ncbi:hypothetical protein PFISCL1PPCAC_27457, partial [Pristionchus fissidentatus]